MYLEHDRVILCCVGVAEQYIHEASIGALRTERLRVLNDVRHQLCDVLCGNDHALLVASDRCVGELLHLLRNLLEGGVQATLGRVVDLKYNTRLVSTYTDLFAKNLEIEMRGFSGCNL